MRLIDADAFVAWIESVMTKEELSPAAAMVLSLVEGKLVIDTPKVDAEPVRHGHWEQPDYMAKLLEVQVCSVCSGAVKITDALYGAVLNYCPHCGAKMDEEEKDCERCLQVTERPGNDICKACGGRRGQDASRVEENDLRDLRE